MSLAQKWGDMMTRMREYETENDKGITRGIEILLNSAAIGLAVVNAVNGKIWDAVVGPVPLNLVTYYDFAESDSVVKYRAFGGEFFAHQGGDKTALRIDFMLVGPEKELWVNTLRLLRLLCKTTTRGQTLTHTDESYLFDPIGAGHGEGLWRFKRVQRREARLGVGLPGPTSQLYTISGAATPGGGGLLTNLPAWIAAWGITANSSTTDISGAINASGLKDYTASDIRAFMQNRATSAAQQTDYFGVAPSANVDPLSIKRIMTTDEEMRGFAGEYEAHSEEFYKMQELGYFAYHFNFTVTIDSLIFTNMWLETVQFTKDSRNGVDVVMGHLLLRKYTAPPRIRWSANGRNPTARLGFKSPTKNDPGKRTAIDKWVWIWQDKQSSLPQVTEYGLNIGVGAAKSAMIYSSNPYKYINCGFFSTNLKTVNVSVAL